MSTDGIDALLRKREELLAQVQGVQSAIYRIDQALALIGYCTKIVARRFANGELMRLNGDAERAGNHTPVSIAQYIMASKGMDVADLKLRARVIYGVKECRKRMNARGG